jgi:hypothetical protein
MPVAIHDVPVAVEAEEEPPPVPGAAPAPAPVAPAPAPTPMPRADPDEITRTLANLADLRDRGAISADDYESKKADLLGRL